MKNDPGALIAQARALREKLINCDPNDTAQRLALLFALLDIYEELVG